MTIVKEPYLTILRDQANEFKKLADGEPDDMSVTQAWATFEKMKQALANLAPNHPEILRHM